MTTEFSAKRQEEVFKRELVAMLTPVHMENVGRFADVITILDGHTNTVEKQSWSKLGIALSEQATSFDWGRDWGGTVLAFTAPNSGDLRRGRPPDG